MSWCHENVMQGTSGRNLDVAIIRDVSPALAECELTYLDREPIDLELAVRQHAEYARVLRDLGLEIVSLPGDPGLPDCCFVEDVAIVLDELAVITRPGAPSRRAETTAVAEALGRYRRLATIQAPGTVDGGDVLVVGRKIFVGRTLRTNDEGIAALRAIVSPHGYEVAGVGVTGCLHLKSAATALDDDTLLANTDWIDEESFRGYEIVPVPAQEPGAANVLAVRGRILMSDSFPLTRALLERPGSRERIVIPVCVREFEKAEAAVTCKSLVFRRQPFASPAARG
jgi:dimethylargininase